MFQGDDAVFACAHDSADDSTRVYLSYNEGNKNVPLDRHNVSHILAYSPVLVLVAVCCDVVFVPGKNGRVNDFSS